MKLPVPDYISKIEPYVPGKPIEELEREYGIEDSVKLASNENPLGPSPKAAEAVIRAVRSLHRYPDGNGYYLIGRLSAQLGVSPESIVLGNGSDDIIGMLARVFLEPGVEVIIPHPTFLMYEIAVKSTGADIVSVPLADLTIDLDAVRQAVTPQTRMIFICNPNNPTGTILTQTAFDEFIQAIPEEILVVIDEAYIEFTRDAACIDGLATMAAGKPIVTLRTFSKAYGLAGLRIGYGVTHPGIADLLNRVRMPFNANLLAQAGACAALDDTEFLEKTVQMVHAGLDDMYDALNTMGVRYFPTQANFFLIDVGRSADGVFQNMLRQGVIIRSMRSYGFPEYIRVNAGTSKENQRFIKALEKVLS